MQLKIIPNCKNMNKLASIIVLTYNAEKYIENCFRSVFAQTYRNIELIVIDNASKDKSVEIIKNIIRNTKIQVQIIENKINIGYVGGNNLGIERSKGEYVVILNPDVILDENYIKIIVDEFEKN